VAGLLLSVEDRQVSNLLFSISIILWLWLSELEVIERKLFSKANKILLILAVALLIVMAYASLGVFFSAINEWLPDPLAWIFSIVAFIAVASLFYNAIHWLAVHNPVGNIGKEPQKIHRHFMVDHKPHKGV
jgi:cytochrome bd-type quinol oxidase subunit 2